MNEEAQNKKDALKKTVRTRIKGLGLDALFHQVDVSQKDEDRRRQTRREDSPEERALIDRLKRPPTFSIPTRGLRYWYAQAKNRLPLRPPVQAAFSLGPHALKWLSLQNHNGQNIFSPGLYLPIPSIMKSPTEKCEQFIKDSLTQSPAAAVLPKAQLSALIPRAMVIVKILTLPTGESHELKKMLDFEAEHHLPFPLSEVDWDYHILEQGNNQTQLLLAAVKKDDLAKLLASWERIGMRPEKVEVSSLALYNAMLNAVPAGGFTLQVYIGSGFTDINVVQDGRLTFTRGIPWGAADLTIKLSEALNLGFDDAEKIKKDNGILLLKNAQNETQTTVSDNACRWADQLALEMERTIQHVRLEKGLDIIDRIVLTGGGSRLANLNEYLREKFKAKTMILKNRADLDSGPCRELFHKHFAELVLLLGLLRTDPVSQQVEINLLPQQIKKARQAQRLHSRRVTALGAVGTAALVFFICPLLLLGGRARTLEKIDGHIRKLEPQVSAVKELKGKIQTVEDYISAKQSCMEVLREISLLVSSDIIIESFSFEKNESIAIIGEAGSHASAVNLSLALNESPSFRGATLKYTRRQDRQNDNVDFEIICGLP